MPRTNCGAGDSADAGANAGAGAAATGPGATCATGAGEAATGAETGAFKGVNPFVAGANTGFDPNAGTTAGAFFLSPKTGEIGLESFGNPPPEGEATAAFGT